MTARPSPHFDHLRVSNHNDVLVLTFLDAELSADETVHSLRMEVLTAISDPAVCKVIIDLQHVRYLGSAAMRPFLTLKHKLKERGGRVVLCGLAPVLLEVLRVTRLVAQDHGLTGIFESVSDVPAALARLGQQP
jgi:anti-anti-sigma factor